GGTYQGAPTLGAAGLLAQDTDTAASFDGVDDRIKVQNSLSLGVPSSLTFEAWVKRTSTATVQSLFDKSHYWANFPSSGRVQFGLYLNGAHVQLVSGSNQIAAGTTYHLAFTWDGATMRIYKNGVEIASKPAAGTLSSSYDLIVGAESSGYEARGEYFLGSIDDAALYGRALAVEELRQHYAVGVADTAPPETTITAGPTGTTTAPSATFALGSSEAGSSFECRLGGGAWSSCTSPKSYSGLAPGEHTFEARATDKAFNVDPTPASRTWVYEPDTTAPETTITSGPSGLSTSPRAAFEFTADESGATFQCRLDAGAWSSCSSPKSHATLADGTHTFEVRATDPSSNTDQSPAARTWTVEVAAYASLIRSTSGLVGYWRFGEATGTTAIDETSTKDGEYRGSPGLAAPGLLAADPDTALHLDGIDDHVKVLDTPAFDDFTGVTWEAWIKPSEVSCGKRLADRSPIVGLGFGCNKDLRFSLRPNGVFTDLYSPAQSFAAGQTYHVAVTWDGAAMRIYKNGAEIASRAATGTLANSSYNLVMGAESGGYDARGDYFSGTLDETALYRRGLTAAEVKRHYDVGRDPTPPETTITASPPESTDATTASFEFSSSEPSSSFECRLDGGAWAACSSPHAYTALAPGQHAVDVRATDAAGNTDRTPASRTWTIYPCSVRWTGPLAGGTWQTATNWSTGAVPTAGDSVCLPAGAAVTLSGTAAVQELHAADAALTVQNGTLDLADGEGVSRVKTLTLSGTVTGPGKLRVGTSLAWNGGAMTGPGTTVLEAGATGTVGFVTLDRRTLRNEGSITQEANQRLTGKNGAVLENDGTYTLNAERCSGCTLDAGLLWTPAGDLQPRIVNTGTFRRSAGAGYARVGFGFENQGSVSVAAGNVFFDRGATGAVSRGSWAGTDGGTANLTGAFSFGSDVELTGAVKVTSQGVLTVGSLQAPSGSLTVDSGATLDLDDDTGVSQLRDMTLAGSLRGPGTLRIGGSLAWTGGTMSGSGTTVLEPGATGTLGVVTLDQRTLRNEGSITHEGSQRLTGRNGALLDNRATYILNAERCNGCTLQAGILWTPANDAEPRFVNHGTLRRTAGAGYAEVSFGFENQGAVSIGTGAVGFRRGASGAVSRGSWAGSGTGAPQIIGPFSFGPGTDIAGAVRIGTGGVLSANDVGGAGSLTVDHGGTLDLPDPLATSSIEGLTLAGTLTGAGGLRVGTALTWNHGTMRGTGTTVLEPGAVATMNGGTLDRRTLRNEGEIVQAGTQTSLLGKDGAVVDNRGTYTLNAERCGTCPSYPGILWTPADDAQPKFV
ncbi:MAG: hypothetical protein M3320_03300, partial [Actinomycetota bacterium]|nr:hypothetical protein [Actinomycetota bacterium]